MTQETSLSSTPLRLRLREDVELTLIYDDRTPFGAGFTGLCDALLQRTCAPFERELKRVGTDRVEALAKEWMPRIMGPRALGRLYTGPRTLREDCLYPKTELVTPVALELKIPDRAGGRRRVLLRLDARARCQLAPWIGRWSRGAARPRDPAAARLWDQVHAAGGFEAVAPPKQPLADGVTFVGHAAVAFQGEGAQLLVDPFLLPPSPEDPPGMRPHTPCDLAPSAVFITHSHPDHYDIPTLLRLGHDTPIYVPAVPRETLLATDMVLRLRELGFSNVRAMAWHDEARVGPFKVIALPFYGEQPTDGRILHPEARNLGNTYVVEGMGRRVAMLADAGRDAAGCTIELAAWARERHGPVDMLFGGYRAWRLQPIRYLFSSVARYLLLVPPSERTRWQKIMHDADDLVAAASAWGARELVPYANGGAPWFARIGLGPHGTDERPDDHDIDPPLSCVEEALARAGAHAPRLYPMTTGETSPLTMTMTMTSRGDARVAAGM